MSQEAQVPGGPMVSMDDATFDAMEPSGAMVNQVNAYGGGPAPGGSPIPAMYFLAT